MKTLISRTQAAAMKEDAKVLLSVCAHGSLAEDKDSLAVMSAIRHYSIHQDAGRAIKMIEKVTAKIENPVAIQIVYEATQDPELNPSFLDAEPDGQDILVYLDEKLPTTSVDKAEAFLSRFGSVNLLALPEDEVFESIFSNFYVYSVTPSALKESINSLLEKIKKGVLYKRAKTSASLHGGDLANIRKAMLRSLGQKGFINHNIYRKGGDADRIAAWEKFVGKRKSRKK